MLDATTARQALDCADAEDARPGGAMMGRTRVFCAACLAPYRFSYRALGARCSECGKGNDGSGGPYWLWRSELEQVANSGAPRPAAPAGAPR